MEIPGYELSERTSIGTDHELYVATQAGSHQKFVVRVQQFDGDVEAQRQYLESLGSRQGLRHRNLCEIVSVGELDSSVYVVTPFYSGGSLSETLASGLSMPRLVRIATGICDALAVLHAHDYVHGDIKPSNVVFDELGAPVLIDDSYFEPQHLARQFTLGYGAPEVAQGKAPTAVCDVYSLGMLLLRVLNGDLPWHAADSDEPRTQSATDTLPPFGPEHAEFEDLIKGMLAFDPETRTANVALVKTALAAITATGDLNTVAVKSDLISTAEIAEVLPPSPDNQGLPSDRAWAQRRASTIHWLMVNSVWLVGLWSFLVGLYEIPATKRMLADFGILENAALVEARLNAEALGADPNQNLQSIVAAYEAVLEIEPEDVDAIEAISSVRSRWENDFAAALTQNDLNVAQNRLDDLLAIFPDDSQLQSMFDELQTRRHALRIQSDTLALIRVTAQEPEASADMALRAFREVIRLYPASVEAAGELDKLAEHFSADALREIELGNIQAAMDSLSKASLANENYGELATVRERIQRATTLRAEIEARLAEASDLRGAGRLIDPPERNAAMLFHSVLTTDPDNEVALRGLRDVSNLVVAQFDEHLRSRDFGENRHIIERAKSVGLYPASIMHMESSMADELNNISQAADFVVAAERFIADGYITEPSDDNAVIALREARRLDATNGRIEELFALCVTRLTDVASDARAFGLEAVATTYSTLASQVALDASR